MSKWIDFVKAFAKEKGMKYGEALKNAECKEAYHKEKGKGLVPEVPNMGDSPPVVLNKPMKEKKPKEKKPKKPKKPKMEKMEKMEEKMEEPKVEGAGVMLMPQDGDGLTHIYPLSHQVVLEMCKHVKKPK